MFELFEVTTFLIGFLGYFALLIIGPMALTAARKGRVKTLPFLFRSLALLVCVSHLKFQYYKYFDVQPSRLPFCELSGSQCTLGTVTRVRDVKHEKSGVWVRFFTNRGEEIVMKSHLSFYDQMPEVGDVLKLRYSYHKKENYIDYLFLDYRSSWRPSDNMFLIISLFIIGFSIFMEFRLRIAVKDYQSTCVSVPAGGGVVP